MGQVLGYDPFFYGSKKTLLPVITFDFWPSNLDELTVQPCVPKPMFIALNGNWVFVANLAIIV